MSLSSFKGVWLKCTPHIKVITARSEVCFLSEKHRNAIREPVTDAEKLDATANFPKKHLQIAGQKKNRKLWQIRSRNFKESSEDMCVQILAQSHSQKLIIYFWFITANWLFCLMGPLYFLVHLTWVRENGLPRQYMYNYLVDESQTIQGKLIRLISRGGRIQRGIKVCYTAPFQFFISFCMHVEDCCPPQTLRKNPTMV